MGRRRNCARVRSRARSSACDPAEGAWTSSKPPHCAGATRRRSRTRVESGAASLRGLRAGLRGARRRVTLVRVVLAIAVLAGIVWALPVRRAGQEGGHHAGHAPEAPALDLFERAGVTEFKEGQRGPGLRLAALDGQQVSLEDWRDKAIVLNFWATWCQPCTAEMPTLEALWRDYRERGLVVVGVSVDRGAPRAAARSLSEEPRPHLPDPARPGRGHGGRLAGDRYSRDLSHPPGRTTWWASRWARASGTATRCARSSTRCCPRPRAPLSATRAAVSDRGSARSARWGPRRRESRGGRGSAAGRSAGS